MYSLHSFFQISPERICSGKRKRLTNLTNQSLSHLIFKKNLIGDHNVCYSSDTLCRDVPIKLTKQAASVNVPVLCSSVRRRHLEHRQPSQDQQLAGAEEPHPPGRGPPRRAQSARFTCKRYNTECYPHWWTVVSVSFWNSPSRRSHRLVSHPSLNVTYSQRHFVCVFVCLCVCVCVFVCVRLMAQPWGPYACSTAPWSHSTSTWPRATPWCATAPRTKPPRPRSPCTCKPPCWCLGNGTKGTA